MNTSCISELLSGLLGGMNFQQASPSSQASLPSQGLLRSAPLASATSQLASLASDVSRGGGAGASGAASANLQAILALLLLVILMQMEQASQASAAPTSTSQGRSMGSSSELSVSQFEYERITSVSFSTQGGYSQDAGSSASSSGLNEIA